MKTLIQKLPLADSKSFVCRSFKTPYFETPWHRHIEHEILLIKEGAGTALIGDYVGNYKDGDIFFIGSNIPHWFRKHDENQICEVLVIQFDKKIFGHSFLRLPELKGIHDLLDADLGLLIGKKYGHSLLQNIQQLEHAEGYRHVSLLLESLEMISSNQNKVLTQSFQAQQNNNVIGEIYDYTFNHFHENIKLETVAQIAKTSISNFGRFFKINTKKTYTQFLKEIRIAHACKLLKLDHLYVSQIFHECGYQNISHFNRQFKDVKGITPTEYRKQFS